jgi:mono/diheme cytochrome c family protein
MRLSIPALLAIPILSIAGVSTAAAATPTFNKDIAPILYQNCATCHRSGEVAPFSLLTYQDASKRAKLIATVTERRYMPPWKAEPGYGKFRDERRLSDAQIALLKEWADAGAPEGDLADKPALPTFTDGWQNGKPDKILTIDSKYSLAADGPDQFRCFVLPLNLDHDSFVSSLEFRPDNRRVVHHALVFVDSSGVARTRAARNGGSYPCFGGPGTPTAGLIGGWAPGALPPPPSEDNARPVPQGSDLVIQIHYHPSGKAEMDQSSLGLTFSSGPPTRGRTAALVLAPRIDIPAGEANYVVKGQIVLPREVEVVAIAPHSHYLGKEMKLTAHLPDGSTIPLIWIKDWDFNWQGAYFYENPFTLPKDTRIDLEYTFDNSENNPRNPAHPPVRVKWGEQTTDEMALAFLGISLPTPAEAEAFQRQIAIQYLEAFLYEGSSVETLPSELSPQQRQGIALVFRLFDRNGNGKLDADEREPLLNFLRNQAR